jgi:hypothetical protein
VIVGVVPEWLGGRGSAIRPYPVVAVSAAAISGLSRSLLGPRMGLVAFVLAAQEVGALGAGESAADAVDLVVGECLGAAGVVDRAGRADRRCLADCGAWGSVSVRGKNRSGVMPRHRAAVFQVCCNVAIVITASFRGVEPGGSDLPCRP